MQHTPLLNAGSTLSRSHILVCTISPLIGINANFVFRCLNIRMFAREGQLPGAEEGLSGRNPARGRDGASPTMDDFYIFCTNGILACGLCSSLHLVMLQVQAQDFRTKSHRYQQAIHVHSTIQRRHERTPNQAHTRARPACTISLTRGLRLTSTVLEEKTHNPVLFWYAFASFTVL